MGVRAGTCRLIWAALVIPVAVGAQQPRFVSIGTGGLAGIYYPTGSLICDLVNADTERHGIRCSAESTGGTLYNIDTVAGGDLEFGIAQSDWQYHAVQGTANYAEAGPVSNLRAVFSLQAEALTVLARQDSGIEGFADVRQHRLNLGPEDSGFRTTTEVALEAFDIGLGDLDGVTELDAGEMLSALCEGRVDAVTTTVGHPSEVIDEAGNSCDVHLVDVAGTPVDTLLAEQPYYRQVRIPAGTYPWQQNDVSSFGVSATFITAADVSEDLVYEVVSAVFGNLDAFRAGERTLASVDPASMVTEALSAPLHPGAARYYRERGWLP